MHGIFTYIGPLTRHLPGPGFFHGPVGSQEVPYGMSAESIFGILMNFTYLTCQLM